MHAKHAKGGEARRRPVLSAFCAVALALGLALPYAAMAEDASPADDTAFENVVGDAGTDGAADPEPSADAGDEQGDDEAEEAGADDTMTDDTTDADDQGDEEASGAGDPQDSVSNANGENADGEVDSNADADTVDTGDDGSAAEAAAAQAGDDVDASVELQADDGASTQADEVTVTFYGPDKTVKTFPAGTALTAADLPSMPATFTFEMWCEGSARGTFAGWYVGIIDENGTPKLLRETGSFSEPILWRSNGTVAVREHMGKSYTNAEGLLVEESIQLLPVYTSDLGCVMFDVCREYDRDKFSEWYYDTWFIPAGYILTKADVKILGESFANNSYQDYALFEDGRKFLGFFADENTDHPLDVADLTQKYYDGDADIICALYGWGPEWTPPADEEAEPSVPLTVTGNTGIKASGNLKGENVPEGVQIEVATSVLTSGPAYDDLDKLLGSSRIGEIYNVTLLVNGREVHDKFGTLTITKPIDPKYNGHVIVTYHRHADGSVTTSRSVARDGYITYTVTDLSAFAMVDGGLPPEDDDDDDEGAGSGRPAAAIPDTGKDKGGASDKGSSGVGASLAQSGDASSAAPLAAAALASLALAAAALRRTRRAR